MKKHFSPKPTAKETHSTLIQRSTEPVDVGFPSVYVLLLLMSSLPPSWSSYSLSSYPPLPFHPPPFLTSLAPLPSCSQFYKEIFLFTLPMKNLYMFLLGFSLLLSLSGVKEYRLIYILCFTASIYLWVRAFHAHLEICMQMDQTRETFWVR